MPPTRRLFESADPAEKPARSTLLTSCGGLIGSIGVIITVVLVPATFLVAAGSLGLIDMPGWAGDNTTAFGFFLLVVPIGLAVATLHFVLGGLIISRRFWPVDVAVLLPLAVVTLFPLGLRIEWPFLSLTLLYVVTLVLCIVRHEEFE